MGASGAIGGGFAQHVRNVEPNAEIFQISRSAAKPPHSRHFDSNSYELDILTPKLQGILAEYKTVCVLYAIGGGLGLNDDFSTSGNLIKQLDANLRIQIGVDEIIRKNNSADAEIISVHLSSGVVKDYDSSFGYGAAKCALEYYIKYIGEKLRLNEFVHGVRLPPVLVPAKKWCYLRQSSQELYITQLREKGLRDALTISDVCTIIHNIFNLPVYKKYTSRVWDFC